MKKKQEKKKCNPILAMLFLSLLVIFASFFGEIFGLQANQTIISSGTLETTLVVVNNIFSLDGVKYIFNNLLNNFTLLEPIILLLISFATLSIFEASGLAQLLASKFKNTQYKFITFITLIISIIFSFLGEYSFIFLIPFFAIIYKHIGRNPIIGVLTSFLGLTMGYGTSLIISSNDCYLGSLTQLSAALDIDKTFVYNIFSEYFIMYASTIILAIFGTMIIEKILIPRLSKYKKEELKEYKISKKANKVTLITLAICFVLYIYMIIPNLPLSGILLQDNDSYILSLLGDESPFIKSFPIVLFGITILISFIHGRISGNIKNNKEFNKGLNLNFDKLGYPITLLLFYTLLITILNYTNLHTVIAINLIDFLSTLEITGFVLIIILFFLTILLSLIIPSSIAKWELMSPILVPLLMRANITPNFTTFIFKAADGIGKSITPLFAYFILMIAFLDVFDNNDEISILETLKKILPTVGLFILLWLAIILAWYLVGFPIGINTYPTI
ncbi:MAG: AbgT family transporter [Mycoplasmatota bacterium]